MTPTITPVTEEVNWVVLCDEEPTAHVHNSVYIIDGDATLLIDTGSHIHRPQIREAIAEVTDGEGLDGIVLTHSDLPHAANAKRFAKEYDVEIHSTINLSHAQGLFHWGEGTRRLIRGQSHDIEGRRMYAGELVLTDRPKTPGLYDYDSQVLFPADGFGITHRPGACVDRFETLLETRDRDELVDRINAVLSMKLPWVRYVFADEITEAMDEMLDEFDDIEYLCPVHGPPIQARDIDEYLSLFEDAVQAIHAEYEGPTSPNPSLAASSSR